MIADGIWIDLKTQSLQLRAGGETRFQCLISSGKNGIGEQSGSGKTPRGRFRIRIKIGAGAAINSVFVSRRLTGEIYSPELAEAAPHRDWILSRIMWLSGMEVGHNRGGDVDTLRRYIYIHGCPDSEPMGVPMSHGCIRMRNQDIVTLFERVNNGDLVVINS